MLEKYPTQVKIVFKNFPLKNHSYAMKAAIAALSAFDQGKFWEFHDLLFKNLKNLNDKKIEEIVTILQLDAEKFKKKLKDPMLTRKVRQDYNEGIRAGVRGTPTIFVNGRKLKDRSIKGFDNIIKKELAESEKN